MLTTYDPAVTTNPAQWLPYCIEYMEGRERMYLLHTLATWPHLLRARAMVAQDLARARKRGYLRAAAKHEGWLALYDRVLEAFAPLMQDDPTLTFAEACGRQRQHPRKRVVEL